MAHDSSEHLRFDSRLAMRRGWISQEELEKRKATLPDLTEKAEFLSVEEEDPEAQSDGSDSGAVEAAEGIPAAVIPEETADEPGELPSF